MRRAINWWIDELSGAREFHPRALPKPDVTIGKRVARGCGDESPHPAKQVKLAEKAYFFAGAAAPSFFGSSFFGASLVTTGFVSFGASFPVF